MTRIDEIYARTQAATAGPWKLQYRFPPSMREEPVPKFVHIESETEDIISTMAGFTKPTDMRFIAAAREDIPYLLGEVNRLTNESKRSVKLPVGLMQNRITDPYAKYDLHSIHSECYAGFDGTCTMPHCSGCPIRKMYIVMQDIENQAEAALATQRKDAKA